MHVLFVLAHPEPTSFNHALVEAGAKALRDVGHEVTVSDLHAEGFDPVAGADNSGEALFALAALYAWLPVALKLLAVALMWTFPLDEATQAETRRQIETRRPPGCTRGPHA